MGYSFDIHGAQIDGARDYQEDAFLITHLGDQSESGASLVVVADGMGGHAAGNVASNMAVQAFNRSLSAQYPSDDLPSVLRESVISANNSIRETVAETAALKGMGCTLVCAVVSDDALRWVSVGDSHLYLIRDGEIRKKNADHSYGGFLDRLAAEGKEVEPEPGFSRNMLMSALTGDDIADIDCPETPLQLQKGDRIILCSDGLDTLEHDQILATASAFDGPRECVEALLQAVVDADQPRQDNTTIVVVDVGEAGAAAAMELEEEEITEDRTRQQERTARDQERAEQLVAEQEAEQPARSGGSKIGIIIVLLALIAGGGGYFLFMNKGPEIPDDDLVEIEEPGEQGPEEPADEPEPATTPDEPEPVVAEQTAEPKPEEPKPSGKTFADSLSSGSTGPTMRWLNSGSFTMGSSRMAAGHDEKPAHTVRVRRFAISTHEVTIADYGRFAKASGRPVPSAAGRDPATTPVSEVSWDDALYYTRWLSEQTGQRYRLPSEAEWEYAARAGTSRQFWWGRKPGTGNAHCTGCDSGLDPRKTANVGSFKPNQFGIYDTAGNVAEWVHDCYHETYAGAPGDSSVWEGGDCSVRMVRGGSFSSVPNSLRSAKRDKFKSDTRLDSIGIRVVRDPG